MTTPTYTRTMAEVAESCSYGRLYRVLRPVGTRYIAVRYRRDSKKDLLYADNSERITLEKAKADVELLPGDFVFRSSDGIWASWKIREVPKET